MGVAISSTRTLTATGLSLSATRFIAAWVRSASTGFGPDKELVRVGPSGNFFNVFANNGYNEATARHVRSASSDTTTKFSGTGLTSAWTPIVARLTVSGTITQVAIRQGAGAWQASGAVSVTDNTSSFTELVVGGGVAADIAEVWLYSAFDDTAWAAFRDQTALPETLGTLITGATLQNLSSGLDLSGGGTFADTGSGTALAATDTHPITRVPVPTLSGEAILSGITADGSMAPQPDSSIAGEAILAGVTVDGGMGLAPGVITTPVLKNNTGTILASVSGIVANVYNLTTGVLVVRKTGLSSDGSGVVTISDVLLVPATTYAYELDLSASTQGRRLPTGVAA